MTGPRATGETKAPVQNLEVKMCAGSVFVGGFIMNSPCTFIIDTGADVTIMSHRIYTKLVNIEERKPLEMNASMRGIDGNEMPVLGKVTVPIALGERQSTRTVWVARIEENCILGADLHIRIRIVNRGTTMYLNVCFCK